MQSSWRRCGQGAGVERISRQEGEELTARQRLPAALCSAAEGLVELRANDGEQFVGGAGLDAEEYVEKGVFILGFGEAAEDHDRQIGETITQFGDKFR